MGKVLGFLGGIKVYLAVALVSAALAGAGGFKLAWTLQDGNIAKIEKKAGEDKAAAVAAALRQERSQNKLSADAGAKAEKHQAEVRTVARIIREKVPVYVTPEADDRCIVPVGAIRLLDAAAAGADPDASLVAPGEPNDAPSGVDCSRIVDVVAENYALYRSVSAQLNDILDLEEAQKALNPAVTVP